MGKAANVAFFVPHLGCAHACSFCDQRSIAGQAAPPSPADVAGTLARVREQMGSRSRDAEVAFFGGSFTAIPRRQMLALLEAVAPFLGADGFSGIRVSTRPDAVDDDVLALLRAHGVTSIELGAQSMDDAVLCRNGRGHTARQVRDAALRVGRAGFSLGLQMMTGLPGDGPAGARRTARELAALHPDTVRIYPALVLRGTRMAAWWADGTYEPQPLDDAVLLCAALFDYFTRRGIRVLRMGLHAEPSLEQNLLAGPWHPAFGELCESRVYYTRARRALARAPGADCLLAPRGETGKVAGQHRRNLLALEARVDRRLHIREDPGLPPLAVRAVKCL
ncbi:elongator complex protein 3 [Ethanoligenens harbinense]|uniref:Radical SAM domain protein n=1 Tax=Ethanoligenens harbinense (strain DSM 18485 / JCM 12961 / CGMCC 1.5033 / YUAN-3) TaxID=663278 RepID=E6U7X2_ETHHY|nr:radical SAM protein [Ethanoligenens harbinense]ADU25904.1 Radical SAM domain protein [Ethanoligenens harbinense YUAN-3]AVQ95060.1 radical SAM protein [Ethanoligenens harbinense YUAN-3]AYF37751.1 radical SAM protein [Ethanoligenens harbinense]AYF40472.1 radical SAM protein [Ethanoligenens harbinense]QCN91306.1 radical SAM protein [Ethanoligenens harbinense]